VRGGSMLRNWHQGARYQFKEIFWRMLSNPKDCEAFPLAATQWPPVRR
jgi:hypothetical protein